MPTKNQSRPKPAPASSQDDRLRRLLSDLIAADAEADLAATAYVDAVEHLESTERRANRLLVRLHPDAVVVFHGRAFVPRDVAMPTVPEAVHLD
jgi:hypothetical protein